MLRPILSGRLAKWALLPSEFEINFVPQRAIKGQALANFLADHPVPAEWELTEELPDEEIFLVEVLPLGKCTSTAPYKETEPVREFYSCHRERTCSRIHSFSPQIARTTKQSIKPSFSDSAWQYDCDLVAQILEVSLHYVPRSKNGPADALAGIAASLAQFDEWPNHAPICERWVVLPPTEEEIEEEKIDKMEESFPILVSKTKLEIGESLSRIFFDTAHSWPTCESEFIFAEQLQGMFSSMTYFTGGCTKVCFSVVYPKKRD
ncbi:hypothetical protein H6P81_010512 [Aristolochia fimbriata]|uniref:RNase H type-1 domain-containing protein n=1 Tax=Aristolochia fimbriata TaxID=158543 RepID=A0AAV7ENZ9_ARIFI|nr:hypothetical protein H6P81_010512 [Aristolochia fimbriata]